MKYIISYLSVFILIIFAASACSDISDEITTPQEVNIHQEGVLNSSSNNFHGRLLSDNGFKDCQQCHASTFTGGTAGVSCVECHNTINVHQDGLKNPSSDNFHGKYFLSTTPPLKMNVCSECHGVDYEGSNITPDCRRCHEGITVHKDGVKNPSSDNFHGKFIQAHKWDLGECAQCHGETYTGGLVAPTCNTCHSKPGGPESCNTCHGDFGDASKIAPPKDLTNNTSTTAAGVGAHTAHLIDSEIADIKCESCHTVPGTLQAAGHIDETPGAEVTFAGSPVAGGSYNGTSLTCQNTYCHGNFEFNKADAPADRQIYYTADKMTGNNVTVTWNQVDGTQAVCGSCHGLPPTGHMAATLTGCGVCHGSVVDTEGNIIDKTKHINGVINVFEEN